MNMKRICLFSVCITVFLSGCVQKNQWSQKDTDVVGITNRGGTPRKIELKIGAAPTPYAEILQSIKPELKKKGIRLQIVMLRPDAMPNIQLANKSFDANFCQSELYLNFYNAQKEDRLYSVCPVYIEPMGAYSRKHVHLDQLSVHNTIAIPKQSHNQARALMMLAHHHIITLKQDVKGVPSIADITHNSKKLQFIQMDAPPTPEQMRKADVLLIGAYDALRLGLHPVKDAIVMEEVKTKGAQYSHIVVARADNKQSAAIQQLVQLLSSHKVKRFIEDRYEGALIPVL